MIGIMYSEYNNKLRGTAWKFDPQDTGLQAGQSFNNGLVGYEWDKVFENGYKPVGLQILATSEALSIEEIHDTRNT